MDPLYFAKELESLVKKGKKLKPKDLYIIESIKDNPISPFLMNRYIENDKLLLKELISDLQTFVRGRNLEFKMKFLFKMYDYNKNGFISNAELFKLLESITNSKDTKSLQNLVDKVFLKVEPFKNRMNEDEFMKIVSVKNKNMNRFFMCDEKYFKL